MRLGWRELGREKSNCVTAGPARPHGFVVFDFMLEPAIDADLCVLLSGARTVV